ncbi:DUF4351 domain-containing protein [Heliorestis acidaminivorans]|uniref:DUF4351 domain-containing protein n=1 Tax=Heliorestis acidaminivorans TaxID=553427 RepID=A0A6I0F3D7_9FIRM|nr:DUF4351 domain-containing protein [Heliorestis acidaminivorans]KAB2952951.1 DUF4351 domain-containing protein [Heliorestis acidaminivorans]
MISISFLSELLIDNAEALVQYLTGQNYQNISNLSFDFSEQENPLPTVAFIMKGPEGTMACHIEFQNRNDSTITYQMLSHAIKIHQQTKKPLKQFLIYFGKNEVSIESKINYFGSTGQHLDYAFQIVDLGVMQQEEILQHNNPNLLAFLPVVDRHSYKENPIEHLSRSADAIIHSSLPIHKKREVLLQTLLLAGYVYNPELIIQFLAEVDELIKLEESLTYQLIVKKGEELGEERGQKKALTETLLRQLTIRFGKLVPAFTELIEKQDYNTLQILADRIFDFEKVEEIEKYLVGYSCHGTQIL